MFKWVYLLLLVSAVVLVLWKGRREARIIVAALTIGSVLTPILYYSAQQSWLTPNIALLLNEAAVTAVILTIAYRSKEFWPLPIAAFQMIALLTPIVILFGRNLASHALGITQGIWAYPQLAILVAITIADLRRRRRQCRQMRPAPTK